MTREKALEVVRKNMPTDRSLPVYEALQTLIPELCEDEKAGKGLIYHLRELREWKVGTMSPIKTKEHYDAWIAYLEKQSAKWSEEDENMLTGIIERGSSQIPFGEPALRREQLEWLMNRFKFLPSKPRDYAITFWTYLDENRPEGKMCLSNGECADIEKAFIEHDWAKILRYAKKYLLSKEFVEGDRIIEYKVGMHGEPIEIVLDKYAQRARGIFPSDELTVILRIKK